MVPAYKDKFLTWKEFRVEFCKTFMTRSERKRLWERINHRRQNGNEELSSFVFSMINMCREYDLEMSDADILTHVLEGLLPSYRNPIKAYLLMAGQSIANLLTVVQDIDSTEDMKVQPHAGHRDRTKRKHGSHPVRKPVDDGEVICYNCMTKGHYLRDCGKPKDVARIKKNAAEMRQKRNTVVKTIGTVTWKVLGCNQVTQDEDPVFIGTVNGQKIKFLIDFGACCSIIGKDDAERLGLEIKPYTGTRLRFGNSTIETPVGSAHVLIDVEGRTFEIDLLVLNCSNVRPLLGKDFNYKYGITINYKSRTLKFEIDDYLDGFQTVFAKDQSDVGFIDDIAHSIDTGDHPPIAKRYYRVSLRERSVINDHVETMLAAGIIIPSSSRWPSPITLVSKRDTTALRFCVDYRALNEITAPDKDPVPRTDEVFDLLEGCKYFTKLDIAAMYWHIPVNPVDQCKTAFIVPQGLFEFTRMPFGLMNAPATAIRAINKVLAGLNYIICYVYFDDIIVFGKTKEEHQDRLNAVLTRLRDRNVKLSREKCKFE